MHKSSGLLGNIAIWAISGLGVIFFIMIMYGSETGIDLGLYLTYIAFGLGILLAVLSGVMALFSGGNIKSALLPIGAFVVVFAAAYLMADGTVKASWNLSETGSKLISAGLTMTAIAMAVAVGLAIFGSIKKLIS